MIGKKNQDLHVWNQGHLSYIESYNARGSMARIDRKQIRYLIVDRTLLADTHFVGVLADGQATAPHENTAIWGQKEGTVLAKGMFAFGK